MILVRLLLALILFWALLRVFRAVARMLLRRTASGGGASRPGPGESDSTPLTRGERVIDVEFTEREPGRDSEREPETTRRDG
jgi:hypothetical protein